MSVQITINGVGVRTEPGTMLTAVLIESGHWMLRSHPVTGEPRGALCGMGACLECEVQVDDHRDVRACITTVRNGMRVITGQEDPR